MRIDKNKTCVKVPDEVHSKVMETLEQIRMNERTVSTGINKQGFSRTFALTRAAAFAAVFTLIIGASALAAEHFNWNKILIGIFGYPKLELQEEMEDAGVANEINTPVTVNGVTITPLQSLQDMNRIYILFDVTSNEDTIKGFSHFSDVRILCGADDELIYPFPDNPSPTIGISGGGWGFRGSSTDLKSQDLFDIDLALRYDCNFDEGNLTIELNDLIIERGRVVEGSWKFNIPVTDTSELVRTYTPDTELLIADIPVKVNKVIISPMSIEIHYDSENIDEIANTLYHYSTFPRELELSGIINKDGESINLLKSHWGVTEKDGEIIVTSTVNNIIEVDEVETILIGYGRKQTEFSIQ